MQLTAPVYNQVQQRDQSNRGVVLVEGSLLTPADQVKCRFVPMKAGQGIATDWQPLDRTGLQFTGQVTVVGGWYELQVVADINEFITLQNVGVGEVFVVMGHSVAQGSVFSIPGATDPRVVCGPINAPGAAADQYGRTGKADDLPPFSFVAYKSGVSAGPFGSNTHFWALFAEKVAKRENVPVCLFNAAFGGTSLEHWAKSAQGIAFEHSFVNSAIRMPYINLYNALTKYGSALGCRAILSDQGANDWTRRDDEQIYTDYQTVINHLRLDSGMNQLAVVVNRATPFRNQPHIRVVQERVIQEVSDCYAGPDYDAGIPLDKTEDGIHLTLAGQTLAAGLWADAVSPAFLAKATPAVRYPVPARPTVETTALVSNLTATESEFLAVPSTSGVPTWVFLSVSLAIVGAVAIALILSFTKKVSF